MLRVDGQDVPGTEWLTPAGGTQPDLQAHPGLYSLREGFRSSPDGGHWACRDLTQALASIKDRVDRGYGCGPDTFVGANYTVHGKDLWVTDDDGEASIHLVASG